MKQLLKAFQSTVLNATANLTAAAIQTGKVVATAGVAATGVGLHHTSEFAGKSAIAMARGSESLAKWLYKHAPVQPPVVPVAPTPAPVAQPQAVVQPDVEPCAGCGLLVAKGWAGHTCPKQVSDVF